MIFKDLLLILRNWFSEHREHHTETVVLRATCAKLYYPPTFDFCSMVAGLGRRCGAPPPGAPGPWPAPRPCPPRPRARAGSSTAPPSSAARCPTSPADLAPTSLRSADQVTVCRRVLLQARRLAKPFGLRHPVVAAPLRVLSCAAPHPAARAGVPSSMSRITPSSSEASIWGPCAAGSSGGAEEHEV